MTRTSDLPESLARGTMTCCKECGLLAMFAGANRASVNDDILWTCPCGVHNRAPLNRASDERARPKMRSLADAHDMDAP